MSDYSDRSRIGDLQEAQIDQTPLTLHTGETSWPDVTIVGTDGGWVTIQCTFWRGNSGYPQIARLRLDAITAFVYPPPLPR